jgi:hypothetical protein
MDAFVSAASFAAQTTPVLSSFLAAIARPDPAQLIGLASRVLQAYHLATTGDHHRATPWRLGRAGARAGATVCLIPVRVRGGCGRRRRRVRRPVGVGRGR